MPPPLPFLLQALSFRVLSSLPVQRQGVPLLSDVPPQDVLPQFPFSVPVPFLLYQFYDRLIYPNQFYRQV